MSRIVLTEEFRELCDRLRCQPASEGLQGWPVQQLQWLGGMGIVVLAVAILPTLGVGGMALYRTEIPGPCRNPC